MSVLTIVIMCFIVLESLNVMILYFKPESTKGNGVGVFNAYESSKQYPEIHRLIQYLIYWIAGTKVIFIVLLVVILLTGTVTTKIWTVVALILSIGTFFWRLFPLIRQMDKKGEITPKGYAKTLGWMIAGFMAVFTVTLVLYLF